MTAKNKIIQQISANELDEILQRASDERWNNLALLGPMATIFYEENVQFLDQDTNVYQLTKFVRNLGEKLRDLHYLQLLLLGGNQIGESAKHISALKNLVMLDLSGNQIGDSEAEHISALSNLTTLDLSLNRIGETGARHISKLRKLTTLGLSRNGIGNLGAEHLSKLNNLTALYLHGNQIEDLGVEHLSTLSNLTTLNLSNNPINNESARYISKLKKLLTLDLSRNGIGNGIGNLGAEHLSKLSNLTTLDLRGNQIGDPGVEHLSTLSNLTTLNLSNNPINNNSARYIAKLRKLISLDLSETSIDDLRKLAALSSLIKLNVSKTSVTDLSPFKRQLENGIIAKWENQDGENGIFVKDCLLIHPPPAIIQQGHTAVLNYFREIDLQGSDKLLEAKVLIVGEGRAGKTSLLRRLYQPEKPLPTEDETTRGIDICPYHFRLGDSRTFRLNVWDFGGQQIYHATHQFFLTKNSLYILLDDTAKDAKSVTDEGFRYWLEVIDLLSKHSPVLIFQNEKDGRSKKIDIAGIKGYFDNVKGVYSGNLQNAASINELSKEIEFSVQMLPHVNQDVPAKWVDIRQAIEQQAKVIPYFSQQDYFDLYSRYLEFDSDKALLLSQYLHDLGVFLHFQDDDVLRNIVILQNRWATEAVFRVIDDEIVKSRSGRFTIADCERIWINSEYRNKHPELRALMEKFELCYALPDLPKSDKAWLMPQLLPPSMPTALLDWEKPGDLVLTYRYHFLPKGLVSRLMVRKHRYVVCPDLAWANGVLFETDGSKVLVQATSRGNEIVLRARGADAKAVLSVIAADLDALHASFSGLEEKLQKLIPCNCEQCVISAAPEMYEYKYLLKRKQDGRFNIECRASYQEVNVLSLLDGFIPASIPPEMQNRSEVKTASQPETKTVKIFLASSKELRDDRNDFDLYFRQQNDRLRKQGIYLEIIRWENFLDAMSETRLQDEYNKAVLACDIFVSLFMTKTGSFTEEEFDVAYQAFQKNGKPRIYTYFKDAPTSIGSIDKSALQTLWKFQEKIEAMGHFSTSYSDIEHLKRQFSDQLDKLLDD